MTQQANLFSSKGLIVAFSVIVLVALLSFVYLRNSEPNEIHCPTNQSANEVFAKIATSQTSAGYLHEYMTLRYQCQLQHGSDGNAERQRFVLVSDIYIKAWSYAFWNKIFFVISVALAFVVLIWPSISAIAPQKLGGKPIFKSAVVQTTITALAAASFFVYSDYKDKQMSAENLMRYVIHSNDDLQVISNRVIEELTRIDKGFSFSTVINPSAPQEISL